MDREVKRKTLHAAVAVIAVPFLLWFPLLVGVVLALLALATMTVVWQLERRGRRLAGPAGEGQELIAKTLEHTLRPGEGYPWATVYFVAGVLVVAGLTELLQWPKSLAFAAYAVLGMGDSASALIGRSYGTLRIPWNPRKTWEGTAAGVIVAYPWSVLLAASFYAFNDVPFPEHLYWILFTGTAVGMLAETLPGEDNLKLPLVSWAVMGGLAWMTGVV